MKRSALPVFNLDQFTFSKKEGFYANDLTEHIRDHMFVWAPHKHDFFMVVLCIQGSGWHAIDFKAYELRPGDVFFMSPGQAHSFTLATDIEGYIIFHTKEFFNLTFTKERVEKYPFFSPHAGSPLLHLKDPLEFEKIQALFSDIISEFRQFQVMKSQKLSALIYLLYIDLSRLYESDIRAVYPDNLAYSQLRQLEDLVDKNFMHKKSTSEYAAMMHISERHLNRITRSMLDKSTSDIISDRIILEAKRMLVHSKYSISEVALYLGYLDNAYFSRFFKKRTGETPTEFIQKNR